MPDSSLMWLGLAGVAVWASAGWCVEKLDVLPAGTGAAAPSKMMDTHLKGQLADAFARRKAAYEKLKTPEQIRAYQKRMRAFFVDRLGGFPKRTPLNARVVHRLKRDGHRVEKIIFESRPKHYVTALLYLPPGEGPFPGVLVPCGHSANGKAADPYQRVSILLARNGMAALCYDPIGQGERYQVLTDKGARRYGATSEHMVTAPGSILLGRNVATFRIWDGMRGIDYLSSRKEVDAKRIGCTGNSGGGTLTSYLMAVDERIVCAAPSCYLTGNERLLATIGPQDAEQNIHSQLAFGMDHADYVLMRAPKPTLLCCATRDFFDISGTWDTFRQAKRIYTRLGLAERVDIIETDEKHGFTTRLRVGAVRWMRRWLMNVDDAVEEKEATILSDKDALCTPKGQVMLLPGGRSVFDVNRELGEKLTRRRKRLWAKGASEEAIATVRKLAGIRTLADLPKPKVRELSGAVIRRKGYRVEKMVIEPEGGIQLPALRFVPPRPSGRAYLYLHGEGKAVDAAVGGSIEKLAADGHVVLAVDLRGMGETRPPRSGIRGFDTLCGPEWDTVTLAYLLGKSYVGMRAEDVLVCARLVSSYAAGEKPNEVHVIAVGLAGAPALHAAACEADRFASVTLKRSLVSWSNVLEHTVTKEQLGNIVHGALTAYDLTDLAGILGRKVTIVEPVDALGQPTGKAK